MQVFENDTEIIFCANFKNAHLWKHHVSFVRFWPLSYGHVYAWTYIAK